MACLPALRSMTWDSGLMQGFERMDRELTDAEILAAHRAEVFPDAGYADLFAAFGRPSLPATRMAAVLALQALYYYTDPETAEAVRFDVRWKAACGLAVDDAGFDPSSLVYWRGRISRSERPHRVNEAVRKIVEQTGVLKGRRRRAVDSTILADGVATQDTITQLVSAVRKVAREVPGAAEQIAAVCTGHDYSAPGKPKIDWDDPAAKDALVSALVHDANALVQAFRGGGAGGAGGLGGGGSPAKSPKTGWSRPWTPRPGTPASHPRPAGTGTGCMWPPSRAPG